jgi:uncharacterized protein YegL
VKVGRRAAIGPVITLCAILALNVILPFSAAISAESTANEATLATRAASLQTRIFGKAPAAQPLSDRLGALETYLIGKVQVGDPQQRLERLQEILDGKPRPPAVPITDAVAPVNSELFDATRSPVPVVVPMPSAAAEPLGKFGPEGKALPEGEDGPQVKAGLKGKVEPAAKMDPSSFVQSVKKMEERVFGHTTAGADAEASLSHLETFALGRPQAGSLEKRLVRLEGILNGTDPGDGGQTTTDRRAGDKEVKPLLKTSSPADLTASPSASSPASASASASASSPVSASASNPVSASAAGSTGRVLHGHVDTLASTYALAGITLKSNTLPTAITVRLGSRALKAGLTDNDRLLHAELGIDTLSLAIERNGHKFMVEVPLTDNAAATRLKGDDVRLATGATTTATAPGKQLKGTVADDWKVLKQYSIAVLLDVSGSMNGFQPEVGATKNEWCQQQIGALATEAEKLGSGSFDFGTFTGKFTLTPNCTAAQVVQELANTPPGGGTNIAAPLQAAIDSRSAHPSNRPFLIVVITDGLPGQGEPLDSLIVRAAQNARSAGDIKIVFLQIGRGNGQVLADFLDTQLVGEGAPYDIVSSVEWNELSQMGLRSGLIAALNKPAGGGGAIDPERAQAFAMLRERLAISKQRSDQRTFMQQGRQQMQDFRPYNPGGIQNY